MFVVGLLLALLLVGIQAAREAGRRNACQAHLRQIGVGIAAYESTYGVFPPGLASGSLHFAILPYMEHVELYDRLNERYQNGLFDPPRDLPAIPVYLCPSDGAIGGDNGGAGTNYPGNCGTWWQSHHWNGLFVYWTQISNEDVGPVRAADVTDGLSNTSAVSELLRGVGTTERLRVLWKSPAAVQNIDVLANQCRSIPPDPPQFGWRGLESHRGVPWTDGNLPFTLYNHVLAPNQPSCWPSLYAGAYTAASNHRNGVNVLLADGHLAFYSDSVEVDVWRSLASREGGETP